MKIKSLEIANIKGCTRKENIAPITIIIGENASGKSAIADSIRVAALGYDLRLGKRASDTGRLITSANASIEMTFDNGRTNRIDLKRTGASVRLTENREVEFPAIQLDINEFFNRTAAERRKFLFGLAAKDITFSANELKAEIKNIALEKNTETSELAIAEMAGLVDEFELRRIENEEPLDEWFAALIAGVAKKVSESLGNVKMLRAAIQASSAMQAQAGLNIQPVAPVNIEALKSKHAKLLEKLGALKRMMAQLAKDEDSRIRLKFILETFPTEFPNYEKVKAEFEAMQKTFADKAESGPAFESLEKSNDELGDELEELNGKIDGSNRSIVRMEMEINALTAQNSHVCESCGAAREHWSPDILAARANKLQDTQDLFEAANEEVAKMTARRKIVSEEIQKNLNLIKEFLALEKQSLSKQAELSELAGQAGESKARREAAQTRLIEIGEPPTTEDVLKELELEFLLNEKDGLSHSFDAGNFLSLDCAAESLEDRLEAIEAEIQNASRKKRLADEAAANARQNEKQKVLCEQAEDRHAVFTAVSKLFSEWQEKLIAGGIGDFIARAGEMTQAVMGTKLEFREGEIGYWRGTQWVSHLTFSGTEQVLAYCGLCLEFAQTSPCKFIIMDELGRLSTKSKERLLEKIEQMIDAGKLDNFLGIDVTSPVFMLPLRREGFTRIIDLS